MKNPLRKKSKRGTVSFSEMREFYAGLKKNNIRTY